MIKAVNHVPTAWRPVTPIWQKEKVTAFDHPDPFHRGHQEACHATARSRRQHQP